MTNLINSYLAPNDKKTVRFSYTEVIQEFFEDTDCVDTSIAYGCIWRKYKNPLILKVFCYLGGRYMVVDCGGGTVDITVHEITNTEGQLKELFKATGGPYGSVSK